MSAFTSTTIVPAQGIRPFIMDYSVVYAGHGGVRWTIERRLFGVTLRRSVMLDIRWEELADIEALGSGDNVRLRLIPKDHDLFSRTIQGFGQPIRLKLDTSRALTAFTGSRAQNIYKQWLQRHHASTGSA